ncbi:MAG: ABC transporter substrate-binding protein [Promethearchaeota archaeon]
MKGKKIFIIVLICIIVASVPVIYWIINLVSERGGNGNGGYNHAPVINSYYPLKDPFIEESETQKFNISATDPDGDPLTYGWFLNGAEVGGNNSNYIFDANSNPYGTYTVKVNVTDGDKVADRSWTLSVQYIWSAEDCPGAPTDITLGQIIKLGIIADTERFQGEGSWNGSYMAVEEINKAGGVHVDGETYYFGITSENTDEANPILNTVNAVAAANKLINYKRVQYAVGGFRTECVIAYQPLFCEKKIVFINTGVAADSLAQKVLDDYNSFKYFFHPSPQNTSTLVTELIQLLIFTSLQLSQPKAAGGLGHNISRFSFMIEDLPWTALFASAITEALESNEYWNMTYTGVSIAVPVNATFIQLEGYWDDIEDANTQIVIPIFSGATGQKFSISYGANQPHCLPYGINVISQSSSHWDDTAGACNYSITMESVYDTNKTSKTRKFLYDYNDKYSTDPIYTATGSYDAVYSLAWAIEDADSFDPDDIVTALESIQKSAPLMGAGGGTAYTPSHCNYYEWPIGIGLAIQWVNGSKHLIPGISVYPSDPWSTYFGIPPFGTLLNMTSIAIPYWGLYYFD